MDIPRLLAMNGYWDKHPPVHLMVAAYLGIKPSANTAASAARIGKSETENTEQDLQDFVQMFAAAGGAVR